MQGRKFLTTALPSLPSQLVLADNIFPISKSLTIVKTVLHTKRGILSVLSVLSIIIGVTVRHFDLSQFGLRIADCVGVYLIMPCNPARGRIIREIIPENSRDGPTI